MTHRAFTPLLGREFDRFLAASIGDEQNGMALSVVSALARLDVDPWETAVALSRMPKEKAKERLATLIAPLTTSLSLNSTAEAIAARLIALLPNASNIARPAPAAIARAVSARSPRNYIVLGIVVIVLASYVAFVVSRPSMIGVGPSLTKSETNPSR